MGNEESSDAAAVSDTSIFGKGNGFAGSVFAFP
jgi:hypothetical protein